MKKFIALLLSLMNQAVIQTINADSCTHPVLTHKLVCFVTSVFKTP